LRILDHLNGPQGQDAIGNLARAFGLAPDDAKAAIGAIVPELARAVERNTLNRGGIADIVSVLGATNPDLTLQPGSNLASASVTEQGIGALEQIFGSKDKSRAVAARVARSTGVNADTIKAMLPAVAALTMGALAKGSRAQLQDVFAKVPELRAAGPLGVPGDVSTGSNAPLPRQTPLPIPGDTLPDLRPSSRTNDRLPDIIRRGGVNVPQGRPSGGSSLGTVIRDILGGLLGFQNRGFFGWLLQAVILPMALRVIQSVLRRVLTGR
jgi:Bacterial protein of unknown function (DUF937)